MYVRSYIHMYNAHKSVFILIYIHMYIRYITYISIVVLCSYICIYCSTEIHNAVTYDVIAVLETSRNCAKT